MPNLVLSSFSVAAEASPTIMLPVNLYKFDVHSPLRIIMEPLVTLIPPSAPENLYPRASKAPNERIFFFKSGTCWTFVKVQTCPSNIPIQMLSMPTVSHMVSLHQDKVSIIRLISTEPLSFWTHVVCAPESSNQVSEYLSFSDSAVKTSYRSSFSSSITLAWSNFHWY